MRKIKNYKLINGQIQVYGITFYISALFIVLKYCFGLKFYALSVLVMVYRALYAYSIYQRLNLLLVNRLTIWEKTKSMVITILDTLVIYWYMGTNYTSYSLLSTYIMLSSLSHLIKSKHIHHILSSIHLVTTSIHSVTTNYTLNLIHSLIVSPALLYLSYKIMNSYIKYHAQEISY